MISVAILHTPWVPERVTALDEMMNTIFPVFGGELDKVVRVFGDKMPPTMKWSQFKTVIALQQWEWALSTTAMHHVFLTDDLHLAPGFMSILKAMIAARSTSIIGLLSNHPHAVEIAGQGDHAYRCNSWVVGPAYVVPRAHLARFVEWYKALPDNEEPGGRRWFNDDSALNEWNTKHGPGESWHPLPTPIEHRADLKSTVGHGDQYSRERVSWRAVRHVQHHEDGFSWDSEEVRFSLEAMRDSAYWKDDGPMLKVGG